MRLHRNRFALRALLFVVFTALVGACAKNSASGSSTPRRDRSVMDSTELRAPRFSTVYDAVSALRGDWLLARGGPSGGRMPEVGVWIEGQMRTRGVDFLKTIRPVDIKQIKRLSTTESLHSYNWPWGGLVITPR
jgi:hypothetical protein